MGAIGSPANGLSVVVGDEPVDLTICCVLDKPITLTLDLPAGAELTSEEVQALLDQILDFILEKEAALVAELRLIIDDAEQILRLLKDILEDVVIPFLEEVLDDTIGLVVLLKENVFNVCVTVDADLDPVVCTDAE